MEEQEGKALEVWNRPARAMPWNAAPDLERLIFANKESGKEINTLKREASQWKDFGSEELKRQLKKISLEAASAGFAEGLCLLPPSPLCTIPNLPVVRWRNPDFNYSSVGDLEVLAERPEEKDMACYSMEVLCVNYSTVPILEFMAQAQAMHAGQFLSPQQREYISSDLWITHDLFISQREKTIQLTQIVRFSGVYGEEGDRLRALSYYNRDVYLLCFSIAQGRYNYEYDKIRNKWSLEVAHARRPIEPLIVVVGMRAEARYAEEPSENYITIEEGIMIAKAVGAAGYIECSMETGQGVLEVCREAALLWCNQGQKELKKGKKKGDKRCEIQ